MSHPLYTASPGFVRQLQAIDPELSVDFLDPPGRFAIFHRLQTPGNWESTVEQLARMMQADAARYGYSLSLEECGRRAREQSKTWQLVCYVTEEDGSFRPLDSRTLLKVKRMKWMAEEAGLKGIRDMMNARAEAVEATRRREEEQLWNDIRRDKSFRHVIDNWLSGVRTSRHFLTKGLDHANHVGSQHDRTGRSPEARHPRPGGDPLPGRRAAVGRR